MARRSELAAVDLCDGGRGGGEAARAHASQLQAAGREDANGQHASPPCVKSSHVLSCAVSSFLIHRGCGCYQSHGRQLLRHDTIVRHHAVDSHESEQRSTAKLSVARIRLAELVMSVLSISYGS